LHCSERWIVLTLTKRKQKDHHEIYLILRIEDPHLLARARDPLKEMVTNPLKIMETNLLNAHQDPLKEILDLLKEVLDHLKEQVQLRHVVLVLQKE
jgi:hypothetical protein